MTAQKIKGIAGTVVWGEQYIRTYLEMTLPSLLAPGNLPGMKNYVDAEYRIYTREEDVALIEKNAVFQKLKDVLPTRIFSFPPQDLTPATAAQYRILQTLIAEARAAEAAMIYCMPDAVWADGSFAHLGRSLAAGNVAVMQPTVRVATETLEEELRESGKLGDTISLTPAAVRQLALRHLHPLITCYQRSGRYFPRHAEFVLWPVGDEGLLLYYTFRDPKCFIPHKAGISPQLLINNENDFSQIDSIQNTNLAFGLSLTPLSQDIDWIRDAAPLDVIQTTNSMLTFDSEYNNETIRQPVRLHLDEMTTEVWKEAENKARIFFANLVLCREVHRTARELFKFGCTIASKFLVAALRLGRVHRSLTARGHIVAFVPVDTGITEAARAALMKLLQKQNAFQLRRFVASHIIYGSRPIEGRHIALTGEPLIVSQNQVNGVAFAGDPIFLPRITLQPVSGFPVKRSLS